MTEWVKFSVSHSFLCLPTAPHIGLALPPSINQHYPSSADSWRWEASQNPEVGLSTSWNALERHTIQIPQLPAKKSIYPCCARNCYGDITYVRWDCDATVRLWFSNRFHVQKAVTEMGKHVFMCVHFISLLIKNYMWRLGVSLFYHSFIHTLKEIKCILILNNDFFITLYIILCILCKLTYDYC